MFIEVPLFPETSPALKNSWLYPCFLVMWENILVRKIGLISDVINRETNNYDTHIAQYLNK